MSFTAVLIICAQSLGGNCVEVHDARGPYENESECIQRVLQIFQDTQLLLPPPYTNVEYRCDSKFKRA